MAYEKMTLDAFKHNLKEGKYQGATGARRAIGKAAWTDAEKQQANAQVLRHFGEGAAPAAGKTRPAKKIAKKVAVKTAPARKPVTAAASRRASVPPPPQMPRVGVISGSPEMTTRQHSAGMVISALANRDGLSPLEQLTYENAQGEYNASVSSEGRSIAQGVKKPSKREPQTQPAAAQPAAEETEEEPTAAPAPALHAAPAAAAPRIPFPPRSFPATVSSDLTPAEQEQLRRARTVAASLVDNAPDDTRPADDEQEEVVESEAASP